MRDTKDLPETAALQPVRKGHIGLIVAGSVITGLIVASGLAVVVFGGAAEPVITGVVLLAFGLGWAMLALLSSRRTSQPQRWALVPAVLMGALGLAYLAFGPGTGALEAFGWVWPIALFALVIWMIIQSRRSLRSWSRPVILYPLFAVLALAAAGGGYQTIRDTQEPVRSRRCPASSSMSGGYKLHINCTGSGTPAVVLEAGLGEPSSMMAGWIAPAVAASTKVCVYDRAGRGWSEPAAAPQDGLATAAALHTLLARAHVGGPYVLVGHSTGGVYMQIFAATYPGQVAGMVLLDSQPPDAFTSLPGYPGFYSGFRKASALFPSLARFGVLRLVYSSAASGLPPQARAEERASWSTASHYRSVRDEFLELPRSHQAQALKSLGGKPLIVVTAAKNAQTGWLPQQDQMAALSANSVHRVMQNATHISLTEDKTDSRISSQAILDVVHAVRSGTPLAK